MNRWIDGAMVRGQEARHRAFLRAGRCRWEMAGEGRCVIAICDSYNSGDADQTHCCRNHRVNAVDLDGILGKPDHATVGVSVV